MIFLFFRVVKLKLTFIGVEARIEARIWMLDTRNR